MSYIVNYKINGEEFGLAVSNLKNIDQKIFNSAQNEANEITIISIIEEKTENSCDQQFVQKIEKIVNEMLWDNYQNHLQQEGASDDDYYGITDRVDPLK